MCQPSAPRDLPIGLARSAALILDATELFPSELLDDMVGKFFGGGPIGEHWLTADAGGGPLGFAYYVPERMTEGTRNLLAIAVDPRRQGEGIGVAPGLHRAGTHRTRSTGAARRDLRPA